MYKKLYFSNTVNYVFQHIKDAMLKTLSKGLGKYLTPEGKAAWDKLLTNAIKVIGKTLNKHGKS